MNRKIPFSRNELKVIEMIPGMFEDPSFPLRETPVSPRENASAMYYDKHPYWLQSPAEAGMISSPMYNDRLARGGPGGTTDVFGVEWEYVEVARGSMVRPGEPLLKNANEWKDKIVFPDLDSWDWETEADTVKADTRRFMQTSLINGFWFERLVSFMDFMPAAIALIDNDQKGAIKSLFEAMTNFGMKVIDKFCEYWPSLEGINVHDDWGAQKAPFFSQETAYELFVPYMKALTDHIHSKGRVATLHSCGHNATRIQCFIDGGFDRWDPQSMNDTHALYERYGDKIILSVMPDAFDPKTTSESDQRLAARAFVDKFCKPGKPAVVGYAAYPLMTPAFSEELYVYSRKVYGGL